mmetsp:Transcript_133811/g.198997  ORF Transcript_133811/g.198997 Transcript_133811/m.198997 type:complete len:398 (+) Transcript_133811:3-1196(+)
MAVLEQMDLVAPLKPDHAGRWWLALLRLESKTWRAGADIEFRGNIVPGSKTFICSFPGIHAAEWKILTKSPELSTCCVFFPNGHELFGKHSGPCWCKWLYGKQEKWGCAWFQEWMELFKKCIAFGQRPIVLTQRKTDPRCDKDNNYLGKSQRGEVRYAEGEAPDVTPEYLEYLAAQERSLPEVQVEFQDIDSHSELKLTNSEEASRGTIVLYSLRYVPAGLYCRVLASLLRLRESLCSWKELGESRSSCALAATFTTNLDQDTCQFVSIEVLEEGFQVQSTSVAVLAYVCGVVEGLLETQFAGMRIKTLVTFMHAAEWFQVDTNEDVQLSFGHIVKHGMWDLKVTGKAVEVIGKAVGAGHKEEAKKSVTVKETLGGLQPEALKKETEQWRLQKEEPW